MEAVADESTETDDEEPVNAADEASGDATDARAVVAQPSLPSESIVSRRVGRLEDMVGADYSNDPHRLAANESRSRFNDILQRMEDFYRRTEGLEPRAGIRADSLERILADIEMAADEDSSSSSSETNYELMRNMILDELLDGGRRSGNALVKPSYLTGSLSLSLLLS